MPYQSDAQRGFMHAKHPEIAAKWDAEIRSKKHKHSKDCEHAVDKNDPFEVAKAKIPKVSAGLSGAQKAGRKAKSTAKNTYLNATSKPTFRSPYTGDKFGSRNSRMSSSDKKFSFRTGLAVGATGGGLASGVVHSPEIKRNNKKAEELSKARSTLITDFGTTAGKARKYPGFRAGRFAAGTAVGAGAIYGMGSAERDVSRNALSRAQSNKKRRDTIAAKKNGSTTVAKQEKATGGRLAAGYLAPGIHGAIAGKKGSKLRAAGNELGGTVLGSTAGGLAAGVLTRGKGAAAGSAIGSGVGAVAGTARAQRKGHFKLQKNDAVSAFGVDHGY
jgi:hypothetical protein